jgi:hypothetical protein
MGAPGRYSLSRPKLHDVVLEQRFRPDRDAAMLHLLRKARRCHFRVQHKNPAMAFLTFDDEHHRFAFLDLSIIDPEGSEPENRGWIGVDHLAWTHASLEDLFESYAHCKGNGIDPYWCIHHGLTVSMYYADPDGNQMEFQVNAFDTDDECNAYICGPAFEANPVGVEFDPEEWLAAVRAGASLQDFRIRKIHEPVSPIRGEISALL